MLILFVLLAEHKIFEQRIADLISIFATSGTHTCHTFAVGLG